MQFVTKDADDYVRACSSPCKVCACRLYTSYHCTTVTMTEGSLPKEELYCWVSEMEGSLFPHWFLPALKATFSINIVIIIMLDFTSRNTEKYPEVFRRQGEFPAAKIQGLCELLLALGMPIRRTILMDWGLGQHYKRAIIEDEPSHDRVPTSHVC